MLRKYFSIICVQLKKKTKLRARSELKTKTVQVKANETAQEIVNRCKHLFNLETSNQNTNTNDLDLNNSCYQLWLKTGKSEPLIPLIGN